MIIEFEVNVKERNKTKHNLRIGFVKDHDKPVILQNMGLNICRLTTKVNDE
jgi:hypothetical protein